MTDPLNAVIDVSHHNANPDFAQAAAAGIAGVIHKATQGLTYVDPMYTTNRQKALDAGSLWGAYHVGTGGGGAAQANFLPHERQILVVERFKYLGIISQRKRGTHNG